MALSICVAEDVTPATLYRPSVSQGSLDASPRNRRRGLIPSSQVEPQQSAPNLSSWLRSRSKHDASYLSEYGSQSDSRRRPNSSATSSLRRPRLRTFSLLDKSQPQHRSPMTTRQTVDRLSDLVKPLLPSGPAEAFIPATPAFIASPTSPITPAIPGTPSRSSVPQPTRSQSLLRYGAFSYNGVRYSTPKYTSAARQRSSTWSSIESSSSQNLTAVMLPIGQKRRSADPEPFTTCAPVDFTSDEDGDADDEDEREDEDKKGWFMEVIQLSPDMRRRPSRVPAGPRPITGSSSPPLLRGLGLGMPEEAESLSTTVSDYDHNEAGNKDLRMARRRGIDFLSNSRYSEIFLSSETGSDSTCFRESQLDEVEQVMQDPGTLEHVVHVDVQESAYEDDYSWEAQECDNNPAMSGDSTASRLAPSAQTSPPGVSVPDLAMVENSSTRSTVGIRRVQALAEPFDPKVNQSTAEVSVFDSDSEDEHGKPLMRSRFNKFRDVLRNSVSLSSLKPRRSLSASSITLSSPESVSSLRARQASSGSSPGRSPLVLKLASNLVLSPIPASPLEQPSGRRSHSPELLSPPTPATPMSPDSFDVEPLLQGAITQTNTSAAVADPPGRSSLPGRPPDLPLPPTPPLLSTPYTPPRLRLRQHGTHARPHSVSPTRGQRLTVVDPDSSMAPLEISMAKLEAHAPRLESERKGREVRYKPTNGNHRNDDLPSFQEHTGAINNGENAHGGEAVLISLKQSKPMHPSQLSLSSTSTSAPSSSESSSSALRRHRYFVVKANGTGSLDQSTDRVEKTQRPPSLALLPMFEFEHPGHKVLEINVSPPRSTSPRLRPALPVHSHTVSASVDADSSFSESLASFTTLGSSTDVEGQDPRARTPPSIIHDSQEGLSSFMHFTPPPPEPQSRVRKLLSRVNVPGELIRGLRDAFGPTSYPT